MRSTFPQEREEERGKDEREGGDGVRIEKQDQLLTAVKKKLFPRGKKNKKKNHQKK